MFRVVKTPLDITRIDRSIAIRPAYRRLRGHVDRRLDALPDRLLKIDTSGEVGYEEIGLVVRDWTEGSLYRPARWTCLLEGLHRYEVSERDVFLEYGCGKGRVLILAARYPFGKIVGVDISEPMVRVARHNVERIASRMVCKDIEVLRGDARVFPVPDSMTVAFFYNPFQGPLFEQVIRDITASIQRNPRKVRIIYLRPLMHDYVIQSGFREVQRSRPGFPLYGIDLAVYENTIEAWS